MNAKAVTLKHCQWQPVPQQSQQQRTAPAPEPPGQRYFSTQTADNHRRRERQMAEPDEINRLGGVGAERVEVERRVGHKGELVRGHQIVANVAHERGPQKKPSNSRLIVGLTVLLTRRGRIRLRAGQSTAVQTEQVTSFGVVELEGSIRDCSTTGSRQSRCRANSPVKSLASVISLQSTARRGAVSALVSTSPGSRNSGGLDLVECAAV
jgi:hypothetical protein